jgi:hypothetical protein
MSFLFSVALAVMVVIVCVIAYRGLADATSGSARTAEPFMGISLGFGGSGGAAAREVAAMGSGAPVLAIQSFDTAAAAAALPLKEFVIKASYNSASSGDYVSKDAINYVLSRGCRYLDFEVFEDPADPDGGKVAVAHCSNTTPGANNITSRNLLPLHDAMLAVFAGAFASPAPNQRDPLFLRLRLNPPAAAAGGGSGDAAARMAQMCASVRGIVTATLSPRLFKGTVTDKVSLKTLAERIVLILDPLPDADLTAMASIVAGTVRLRTYTYKSIAEHAPQPPFVASAAAAAGSDVAVMRAVSPARGDAENADYTAFVANYGAQICAMQFAVRGEALEEYETFFNAFRAAVVPFSQALPYIRALE